MYLRGTVYFCCKNLTSVVLFLDAIEQKFLPENKASGRCSSTHNSDKYFKNIQSLYSKYLSRRAKNCRDVLSYKPIKLVPNSRYTVRNVQKTANKIIKTTEKLTKIQVNCKICSKFAQQNDENNMQVYPNPEIWCFKKVPVPVLILQKNRRLRPYTSTNPFLLWPSHIKVRPSPDESWRA